jgi:hypothetical protein
MLSGYIALTRISDDETLLKISRPEMKSKRAVTIVLIFFFGFREAAGGGISLCLVTLIFPQALAGKAPFKIPNTARFISSI